MHLIGKSCVASKRIITSSMNNTVPEKRISGANDCICSFVWITCVSFVLVLQIVDTSTQVTNLLGFKLMNHDIKFLLLQKK